MRKIGIPAGLLALLTLAACATAAPEKADLKGCAAYGPAMEVTDRFMQTFNTKDAVKWGETFNFPSIRIASNKLTVINSPADLENSFARLGAEGWDHSAWEKREIVQCEATKAHMLTTFVRYRKDNSVLSRFDSLYIIELRGGHWGISGRSSFAP